MYRILVCRILLLKEKEKERAETSVFRYPWVFEFRTLTIDLWIETDIDFFVLFKHCVSRVNAYDKAIVRQRPRASRRDQTKKKKSAWHFKGKKNSRYLFSSLTISTLYKTASPYRVEIHTRIVEYRKGGKLDDFFSQTYIFIDDWPSSYRWRIASCVDGKKNEGKKEKRWYKFLSSLLNNVYLLSIYPQAALPPLPTPLSHVQSPLRVFALRWSSALLFANIQLRNLTFYIFILLSLSLSLSSLLALANFPSLFLVSFLFLLLVRRTTHTTFDILSRGTARH